MSITNMADGLRAQIALAETAEKAARLTARLARLADPFRCQCTRFPGVPCEERATSEDARCDTCRTGRSQCSAAVGINTDHPRHLYATNFRFTFR